MKERKEMRLVNTGLGRLGEAAQNFGRRKLTRRIISGVLAFSMIATTALTNVGITAWASEGPNYTKAADDPTNNEYTDGKMDITDNSKNSGRIWTDKTVTSKGSTNTQFTETLSALGSSLQYKGGVPSDTVIVFDNSASMYTNDAKPTNEDDTRIKKTIEAINTAIRDLVKANAKNRVAVVAFAEDNSTARTILPLQHYDVRDTEYLHANFSKNKYDVIESGWVNIVGSPTADGKTVDGLISDEIIKNGYTNIQAGIARGLQVLYNAAEKQVSLGDGTVVDRQPAMIVLTDGQATSALTKIPDITKDETWECIGFVNDFSNDKTSFVNKQQKTIDGKEPNTWDKFIRRYLDNETPEFAKGGEYKDAQNNTKSYDQLLKATRNSKDASEPNTSSRSAATYEYELLSPNADGASLTELYNQYITSQQYMVLSTLITAGYGRALVKKAYNNNDCTIFTISVDIEAKYDSDTYVENGETKERSNYINTNGFTMNPQDYFSTDKNNWKNKYNGFYSDKTVGDAYYQALTNVKGKYDSWKEGTLTTMDFRPISPAADIADEAFETEVRISNSSETRKVDYWFGNSTTNTFDPVDAEKINKAAASDDYYKLFVSNLIKNYTGKSGQSGHADFWIVGEKQTGSLVLPNLPEGVTLAKDTLCNYVLPENAQSVSSSASGAISNAFKTITAKVVDKQTYSPMQGQYEGVLTFTDPIGEYMEIQDGGKMTLNLFGTNYTGTLGEAKDGRQYFEFDNSPNPNELHDNVNLNLGLPSGAEKVQYRASDVKIYVDTAGTGINKKQTLTLEIPEKALPVWVGRFDDTKQTDKYSGEANKPNPLTLTYTVGMIADVMDGDRIDLSKVDQSYIEKNTDANGNVKFYTNRWSKNGTGEKTTSQFRAAGTNSYYWATGEGGQDEYYDDTGRHPERHKDLSAKDPQRTKTSTTPVTDRPYYCPSWNNGDITTELGNNASISVGYGALKISKIVEPAGTSDAETPFGFTLTLKDQEGKTINSSLLVHYDGTYDKASNKDNKGTPDDTDDTAMLSPDGNNVYHFNLHKDGAITFLYLPEGATYEVKETGDNYNNGESYRLTDVVKGGGGPNGEKLYSDTEKENVLGYTGKIQKKAANDPVQFVTFTNTRLVELPLKKDITVVDTSVKIDPDKVFCFTVNVTDQPDGSVKAVNVFDENGTPISKVEFKNHKATVYLKYNNIATLKGLLPGKYYTITEMGLDDPYSYEKPANGFVDGNLPDSASAPQVNVADTTITNHFEPTVSAKLSGRKLLDDSIIGGTGDNTGKLLEDEHGNLIKFDFVLEADLNNPEGDPLAAGKTVQNDKKGDITFFTEEEAVYKRPGDYHYTITEKRPAVNEGMIYNVGDVQYEVTVSIVQKTKENVAKQGGPAYGETADYGFMDPIITITKVSGEESIEFKGEFGPEFNNKYSPDEVNVQIFGRKLLENAVLRKGDFRFRLEAMGYTLATPSNGEAPEPHEPNVTQPSTESTSAAEETQPTSAQETESSGGSEEETSEAAPDSQAASGESEESTEATEESTVEPTSEAEGSGEKESQTQNSGISVASPAEPDWWTPVPTLENPVLPLPNEDPDRVENDAQDLSSQPMPWNGIYEVENTGSGLYSFASIYYTEEGVYNYRVSEVKGENGNITYDKALYDVVVTVTRKHAGGDDYYLQAKWEAFKVNVDDEGNATRGESVGRAINFTNTYNPPELHPDKEQAKTEAKYGPTTTESKDPIAVEEDDVVTYYLTVPNESDGDIMDLVVYDTIPDGYTLKEGSISGNGHLRADGRTIEWTQEKLLKGATWEGSFSVKVPDVEQYKTYANTAYAYSGKPGDDNPPDETTTVYSAEGAPEVVIEKEQKLNDGERTKELLTVDGRDIVTYYLTVTSKGTETARNVVVTDVVPQHAVSGGEDLPLVYVKGSAGIVNEDPAEEPDNIHVHYDEETHTITWELGDMDGAGIVDPELGLRFNNNGPTTKTVYFSVIVPDVKKETHWLNAGATYYENNPSNPSDDPEDPHYDPQYDPEHPYEDIPSNEVEIKEEKPELHIQKEQEKTSVQRGGVDIPRTKDEFQVENGDIVTYHISVTNTSPTNANHVTVKDRIPQKTDAGEDLPLTLVEGSIKVDKPANDEQYDGRLTDNGVEIWENKGYTDPDDSTLIIWQIDEIKAGETAEVSFQVKVPEVNYETRWTNIAHLYYTDPDEPDEPSNEVKIVEKAPNVWIEKEQSSNRFERTKEMFRVYQGDIVTYYLTVHSDGEEPARGVVVKDTIPQQTTQGDAIPLILVEDSISDGGTLEADGITIEWNLGDMQVGDVKTVTFQVRIPAVSGTQNWKNISQVSYDNPPEDPEHPGEPGPGSHEHPTPSNEVEIYKFPYTPTNPGGNPGGGPGPDPTPETEIPDNPTPLANFPDEPVPLAYIEDEDVPLAFLAPATGDERPVGAAALFGLLALGMMGAFGIKAFKKDEEEA